MKEAGIDERLRSRKDRGPARRAYAEVIGAARVNRSARHLESLRSIERCRRRLLWGGLLSCVCVGALVALGLWLVFDVVGPSPPISGRYALADWMIAQEIDLALREDGAKRAPLESPPEAPAPLTQASHKPAQRLHREPARKQVLTEYLKLREEKEELFAPPTLPPKMSRQRNQGQEEDAQPVWSRTQSGSTSAGGSPGPPPAAAPPAGPPGTGGAPPPVANSAAAPGSAAASTSSGASSSADSEDDDSESSIPRWRREPAAFQCSYKPIQCDRAETPHLKGNRRMDLFRVEIDLYALTNPYSCSELEAIYQKRARAGWRDSETSSFAVAHRKISECYLRNYDFKSAIKHAKKLVCANNINNSPDGYKYLYIISMGRQASADTHGYLRCYGEMTDFLYELVRKHDLRDPNAAFRNTVVAHHLGNAGAFSLSVFGLERALELGKKGIYLAEMASAQDEESRTKKNMTLRFLYENQLLLQVFKRSKAEFDKLLLRIRQLPSSSEEERMAEDLIEVIMQIRLGNLSEAAAQLEILRHRYEQALSINFYSNWHPTREFLAGEHQVDQSATEANRLIARLTKVFEGQRSREKRTELKAIALWLQEANRHRPGDGHGPLAR